MLAAAPFIQFGVANCLLIVLAVVCVLLAILGGAAAAGSPNALLLVLMLLVLAVLVGVLVPHWRTEAGVNTPKARADLTREYGTVVSLDLQNHSAVVRIAGCGLVKHEMRRVNGVYWLTDPVLSKDASYTAANRPLTKSQLCPAA